MKNEYLLTIWIKKLISLHRYIHFYKDNKDFESEDIYLQKYYTIYDWLTINFEKEDVDKLLIKISNERFKYESAQEKTLSTL
jgi:hypothetical protein